MKPLIILAAAAILAAPIAAFGQSSDPRTRSDRQDRHGVRWLYGERTDPMDDRRQIALSATLRRSTIGLICVQDLGMKLRVMSPGWFFLRDFDQPVQVRIDRGEAFEVTFFGETSDGAAGTVRPDRAGRDLANGVLTANERIILRNRDGDTITIPMSAPRPEADRFRRRCREIAPTLPEAPRPQP